MSLPPAALEHFAAQYGLLSRVQAREILTPAERRRLYANSEIEHITGRVIRHSAAPVTLGAQLLLPVLNAMPRAWLWGESAARWWGFSRDRDPTVNVARVDGTYGRPVGRIHQISRLDPCDVTRHHGIPLARPERVLLTMAAAETRRYKPSRLRERRHGEDVILLGPAIRRMERVTDHAWALGLIDGDFMHDMVGRLTLQGRAGIVVMREVLRDRGPGYVPTDSGTEQRFEEVLDHLAAKLERQVSLSDEHGFIGRVDYVAKRWPLVVEVNGELNHVTLTDRDRDDARYARLVAAGFSVVVIWQYDVWHRARFIRRFLTTLLANRDPLPKLHRPTPAPWEMLADHAGRATPSIFVAG